MVTKERLSLALPLQTDIQASVWTTMNDQITYFYLSTNDFETEMGISASCRLNKLILYDLLFTFAQERKFKKFTLHESKKLMASY